MKEISQIEALYRRYGPSVLRRARAILGDEQRAQDIMQEVFTRVIVSEQSFDASDAPMAWLYRVTRNLCLNRIRDSKRRRELLDEHGEHLRPAAEPSPENALTLNAILTQIDEELRDVAVCFYLDEMTQSETAVHLGVSRRTVGYRLEALRTSVREMLKGREG